MTNAPPPARAPLFVYFAHGSLQIPRVARQCIVGLCEGASAAGAEAEIVGPLVRLNPDEPDHPPFEELYGVEEPVRYRPLRLPFVHADREGRFSAMMRGIVYALFALGQIFRRRWSGRRVVLCARNASVLWLLAVLKRVFCRHVIVIADVHGPVSGRMMTRAIRAVDGVMCISQHLADKVRTDLYLPPEKVAAAHSGVKLGRFAHVPSSSGPTNRDPSRCLLVYAGKVYYRYEEVAYLLDLADQLRDLADVLIVGGRPDQLPPWQAEASERNLDNVRFAGFVEPADVPGYLAAADVLVMYYSPSELNPYRSPGKLFEYLAVGKPLLAARFPSIEEVIRDGENGVLVEPYRPQVMAAAVRRLCGDRDSWPAMSQAAAQTAAEYTWQRRGAAFLDFAERLSEWRARRD